MATKDNELYVYIYDYKDPRYPFQFFIGSRGDGKTYGSLGGAIEEDDVGKFCYSRVTDKEWRILLSTRGGDGSNPFKNYNSKNGTNYGLEKINDALAGIYARETCEDGKFRCIGAPIGYSAALYNIADIRGQDFTDCTDWILDEFVPEKHKRALPDMADAFFNAYETMNRNRELDGEPPMRFWGISNSNNIYNDMFKGLGLVADLEKMTRKGLTDKYYPDRRLAVHLLKNSKIFEEAKAKTALYQLAKGTRFADMALGNEFAYDDFSLVEYVKLKGYVPITSIRTHKDGTYVAFYGRKGGSDIYASYAFAEHLENFNIGKDHEKKLFKELYGQKLYNKYILGKLRFESYEIKCIVLDLVAKR